MLIYRLGRTLELAEAEDDFNSFKKVAVIDCDVSPAALCRLGFDIDRDTLEQRYNYTTAESRYDYVVGVLNIPACLDAHHKKHEIRFFMNENTIAVISCDGYAENIIQMIIRRRIYHAETKEMFLYNFISQIMYDNNLVLDDFELQIQAMEEAVMNGDDEDFDMKMVPVRRELLALNGYYIQLFEFVREFCDNENRFFAERKLKYLGNLMDRAEHLENRTHQLLNYSRQVREMYHSRINSEQSRNMQYLTVISTIFFPLTALTGWYGMNFKNMPELEQGYPFIVAAAVVLLIVIILIFKKKKLM